MKICTGVEILKFPKAGAQEIGRVRHGQVFGKLHSLVFGFRLTTNSQSSFAITITFLIQSDAISFVTVLGSPSVLVILALASTSVIDIYAGFEGGSLHGAVNKVTNLSSHLGL